MNTKQKPKICDLKYYNEVLKKDYSQYINKYGTPLVIFFKERIIQNMDFIKQQFKEIKKTSYFYALKANYNPTILNIIKNAGFGAEVMSEFELKLALQTGFDPSKIIFNGVGKTDSAIKLATDNNIRYLIIDSISEANKLAKLNKKIPILIRCHPNLDKSKEKFLFVQKGSKLGLNIRGREIKEVLKIISQSNLKFEGFSFNIYSRQKNFANHSVAIDSLIKFINSLPKHTQSKIKVIDIGGGFESPLFMKNKLGVSNKTINFFNEHNFELIIEPGRSIVNDSGIVLTKVITKKKSNLITYLVVDIATNYLIPLPLAYYPVATQNKSRLSKYSIVDGICSTAGTINSSVMLSKVNENNVLIILNCGAYTYNMYEHFYDLRPTILLIDGKKTIELNSKENFKNALSFLEK